MNNPQAYAVEIEHIMSSVFNCDRYGVGGIVNSDSIRRNPYFSMVSALTFQYANCTAEKEKRIENFIEKYFYYSDWSLDVLLSFDSNSNIIDGSTYEIDYKNGEEALSNWIKDFSSVCK